MGESRGQPVRGLGLLGAIAVCLSACSFQAEPILVEADPGKGFNWPFFLYLPEGLDQVGTSAILVAPNNTGKVSDDFSVHQEKAGREASGASRFGRLSEELGVPLLIPVFPRPEEHSQFYTHALDRDCLIRMDPGLERLDLQLIAMIEEARRHLESEGWEVDPDVLMLGFSASGMFANRFTLLHPDRVRASAVGSPGGWPMVPVEVWDGRELTYPVGTGDLEALVGKKLDREALAATPIFFFMGEEDDNDSVPFSDSYDPPERGQVVDLFGDRLTDRWLRAQEIYSTTSARAEFKLYPGTGHEISREMMEDVKRFFRSELWGTTSP